MKMDVRGGLWGRMKVLANVRVQWLGLVYHSGLVAVGLMKLSMRNEWHMCDVFLSPAPLKLVQRSSSLDARFLLIVDTTCNIFASVYPAWSPSIVLTGGRLCLLCWLS